jgi:uncharacterized protein (DUF934 family)
MSEPKPLFAPLTPKKAPARLWRREVGFVADPWTAVAVDADLPANAQVILPLDRWLALDGRARAATGLAVAAGGPFFASDPVWLTSPLIALALPKFTDGRAYSIARQLRRAGYQGELRATGDVLTDQVPHLLAVGFDTLDVTDAATQSALTSRPAIAGGLYQARLRA